MAGELLHGAVVRSGRSLGAVMERSWWRGGQPAVGWGEGEGHGAARGGGHIPWDMLRWGLALKNARQ